MDKGEVLYHAKAAYAAAARQTGRALCRVGIIGPHPPPRDDRIKHWAYSLTRVHDSLAIAELDVPWWTYRAIEVVDAWLTAHPKPLRVFEYGSGASTLWLSRRAEEVHSVEHHRAFAEYIGSVLGGEPAIDFRVVESIPAQHPSTPSAKEGYAGQDFSDYVTTIDKVGGEFALIVIDGRAREACLTAAIPHLAPHGVIVFDNTRRARYRRAIAASGLAEQRLRGLTPTLPYPDQTSILTRRLAPL